MGIKLSGKKVKMRVFSQSHITEKYIGWLNDPRVVKYSNQRFIKHTEKSCQIYLKSFAKTNNLFLAIEEKKTDRFCGTMTCYLNEFHGTADLGLMIGDLAVWGKGYGLDAWVLMIDYLFNQGFVRKVTGGTLALNIGMIKIMVNSGMTREAIRSKQEILDDKPVDIHLYSKFINE